MASETQDELLKKFREAAGETGAGSDEVSTIAEATGGAAQSGTMASGQVAETPAGSNTEGGIATSSSSTGSTLESAATTFLEGGLGIVPLITGLMGLFGGSDAQPQLEKYQMPSSIAFESAVSGNGMTAADADQTGAPRTYTQDASGGGGAAPESGTAGAAGGAASGAGSGTGSGATPQITVNVQAMDAQSFMDYSSQIAQAVRGAMLNLSSLNDVVSEL
jgi:hypothetical protein